MTDTQCCDSSAVTPKPDLDAHARLAALCKAVAHPHRVHILRFLLAQQTCFVGEIAEQLPVAASTVSQHLTHLKAAGLITGEVSGPRRCYCVDADVLRELRTLVDELATPAATGCC